MDIDLGRGIDGTETARKVLTIRELPIIFLTSHAEKEYVERVEEISGYGYILKDSGELVLIHSIRMAYKLFFAHIRMKESEEKYRAAFMTSPDSVNINRMDGLYVDINEGFTALTGYSREEMQNRPLDFERVLNGETVQRERTITRKNDQRLPVLMSSRKVEDDCLQTIFHDLTQLKRAEESLIESEERFRLAVKGSRDGLWGWNLETDAAYRSNRFSTMLGYETDELPHTSAAWSELIHPKDQERALLKVKEYLSGNSEVYESTFRMQARDGSYRWIVGRGKALFKSDGTPVRFIGFNTDVTAQKLAEEKSERALIFLENITDMAYEADSLGNISYVNKAVEKIAGVPVEDIVGKSFLPLFREKDRASLTDVYKRTLTGETLENTLTFMNGATCHFTTLPRYDSQGTIIGIFGIARLVS